MTPVTPPSNSNGNKKLAEKKGRQESDSEDEWHPDREEVTAGADDDDDEEYQDDDDDYGFAKKKRKGAPSTPKSKGKGGSSKSTPSSGGKSGWANEEVLAMLKATHRLALQNIPLIAGGPGLEKRGNPTVNSKMRGEFKKIEKTWGGDGEWIDNFKLGPSKKSGTCEMTPVTPPSSSKTSARKKVREPNGSEDDWQPDTEEAAAASGEESEPDEEEASSPKKRKTKGGASSTPKSQGKAGSSKSTPSSSGRAPPSGWTDAEVLAIYRVLHRLGQSISLIAQEPELKGRGNAAINTKMRSEFKKTEKALGGDGKWIDDFKLLPSKKSS